MERTKNMCSFREAAQQAIENACCAFSEKENMLQIAKNIGVGSTVLRNKLNPSQPHRLAVDELVLITKETGNYTIINCVLLQLNMVGAKLDPEGNEETLVKRALENSMHAGDLSRLALDNGGELRLPRRKRNELLEQAHKSVSNLMLLMNDLENKTQGISPFLSMGLDFIVQGNPLPGLS